MKKDLLAGFLHPADAIVPCSACGATEGVPCKSIAKDKDRLKPGFVHFGRRLRRFLLTGAARGDQRKRFEDEAVKMLRKWLAERQPSCMKKRSPAAQRAYDETIRTHPKCGGLLGASARLLCAQFAANEVERAEKKDYNLLALAVACEYCGAKKGECCLGAHGHYRKGTHYKRRALATKMRKETS